MYVYVIKHKYAACCWFHLIPCQPETLYAILQFYISLKVWNKMEGQYVKVYNAKLLSSWISLLEGKELIANALQQVLLTLTLTLQNAVRDSDNQPL